MLSAPTAAASTERSTRGRGKSLQLLLWAPQKIYHSAVLFSIGTIKSNRQQHRVCISAKKAAEKPVVHGGTNMCKPQTRSSGIFAIQPDSQGKGTKKRWRRRHYSPKEPEKNKDGSVIFKEGFISSPHSQQNVQSSIVVGEIYKRRLRGLFQKHATLK